MNKTTIFTPGANIKNCCPLIMAFDPGGTTGCAAVYADGSIQTYQIGPYLHHLELFQYLDHKAPTTVVCETFDNRGNAAAELISLEYIGIIRLWAARRNRNVAIQHPTAPKNMFPDEALKLLGTYEKGMKHSNDAVRHALYFITESLKDPFFIRKLRQAQLESGLSQSRM